MKIEHKIDFKPLVITIETKEEYDALAHISDAYIESNPRPGKIAVSARDL